MRLRSLLFVPGDSERKFEKAKGIGADALILDLEDAVVPSQKNAARALVSAMIANNRDRSWKFFVRVNPLDTGMMDDDLSAIVQPGLDGIILPKANGMDDVVQTALCLDVFEERAGVERGSIKIAVVATETPIAMFNLGTYAEGHARLIGLTWGAEDLAAALGASANRDEAGHWTFPYQVARAQCLFAACAAGVAPIDTVYTNFRDEAGFEADCKIAKRDGFTGRLAIHPDQVAVINRCFSPTESEVEHAKRVVALFNENPDAGTIGIDGQMYDIPHLKIAHRVLEAFGLSVGDDFPRPGFD